MSVNINTRLRQARALMVAQFAFQQRLDRIAWEEETLKPALERLALEAGENLEIPEFVITHEDHSDEN
jgi:hypothetical protein